MFLYHCPKSKRFGYQQPKSYIEVNNKNSSEIQQMNSDFSFGAQKIKTDFLKVRTIVTRLKNGSYKDYIDCADTVF